MLFSLCSLLFCFVVAVVVVDWLLLLVSAACSAPLVAVAESADDDVGSLDVSLLVADSGDGVAPIDDDNSELIDDMDGDGVRV